MSDHQAVTSADHEPTTTSEHTDYQATGLSIAEAARRLGVSENAIRQRIKRETITAVKVDGVWQVFVTEHEADQRSDYQATSRPTTKPTTSDHEDDYQADQEPIEAAYRITPAESEQAIERTAVTYAADMRTMFDQVGRLYEEQLAAKDQTIESQASLITELQSQRDALRGRLSALEAQPAGEITYTVD